MLNASSKLVKIPDEQEDEREKFEGSKGLDQMVETWKSTEFDVNFSRDGYDTPQKVVEEPKRPKKYSNYRANDPEEEDIDEDLQQEIYNKELKDTNNLEKIEKQFKEQEEEWNKYQNKGNNHEELLKAKNMLLNAMKEADLLNERENEENIDKLATDTHKEEQINKIGDINKEMDEIEDMINQQNESNLKRKPMENSMSTIKSSKDQSVHESNRDPFDKLDDVARSVDEEELRKTAKSHKNKRKPWGATKAKIKNKTDYNQLNDEKQKEQESPQALVESRNRNEELIRSKQQEVRQSGRYDYKFENTDEQKIYDAPEPHENTQELENEGEEDYNIANERVDNSYGVFSPQNLNQRRNVKTLENFHKNSSSKDPASKKLFGKDPQNKVGGFTAYSNPEGLDPEIWQQNFEAMKTSYLKVMNENNAKNKKLSEYRFNESQEKFRAQSAKKPPAVISDKKPEITHHAVAENEYARFRKTFKDEEDSQEERKTPVQENYKEMKVIFQFLILFRTL